MLPLGIFWLGRLMTPLFCHRWGIHTTKHFFGTYQRLPMSLATEIIINMYVCRIIDTHIYIISSPPYEILPFETLIEYWI